MNLVLISRSNLKLAQTKQDLLDINPTIKIKTIQFDFVKDGSDVYASKLQSIPAKVSLLINNVGFLKPLPFEFTSKADVYATVLANIYPTTFVTKFLVDRNCLKAILNLSGGVADRAWPSVMGQYSGAKRFMSVLSEGLNHELKYV